ncbi:hypothetical protein ALC62_02145, partial [Cyphomyrmex costatus]
IAAVVMTPTVVQQSQIGLRASHNRVNLQGKSDRQIFVNISMFHKIPPAKDSINMASRSASVTFRMVNGIVAPTTSNRSNRRARRCSKRSLKPSFPSMERGLAGVTMTGCDPDLIGLR